jgi:hypothetical protein
LVDFCNKYSYKKVNLDMISNRVLSDVRVPIVTADFNHIVNWSSSKTCSFLPSLLSISTKS